MTPTFFQRLFTDNKPFYFLIAVGAAAMLLWTGWILRPMLFLSVWNVVEFGFVVIVAACLGAVLGAFPGALLLLPLLHWIEFRNGAPFHEGDEVLILSKHYRGRITRIYTVWGERHQVRVELGVQERKSVTDVFSYTDIYRRRVGK
jgi:hypothetical protein